MCAEYADAVALLRELADGYQRRGDNHALATTHRRLALAHELRGQWESALAAREAAALAFSAAGRPGEAAIDRLAVATHLRSAASYSVALTTLGAVCDDAQSAGRPDLLLRAQGLRGNVLSRLGRSREGIAAVRAALDQALAEITPRHCGRAAAAAGRRDRAFRRVSRREGRICGRVPVLRRPRR